MSRSKTILAAAFLVAVCLASLPCAAQEYGAWRAASTTATAITGDIAISNTKISINFISFPMAQIRTLNSAEVAAAFDADASAGTSGTLYRLNIPARQRFLHKNTLCGTEDTQWMAAYVSGRTLQVDFFSGPNAPVFTMDALSKSSDLCATFTYAR